MTTLYDKVIATRDQIREVTGCQPALGLILGSGLGGLIDALDDPRSVPYTELPHIPQSTVPGHAGRFVCGTIGGVPVAMLAGRSHFYEGHELDELTIGARALVALGCKGLIVTNAAGGIRTDFRPGDLMAISDHINLQWKNPLRGPHDERLGERFVDMTGAYDRRLRRLLHQKASAAGLILHDGVYAAISGPSYETPAEIRMMRTIGADAIGMSTVHEVIAARHAGARIVGVSLISNLAAGIDDKALSHDEVTATAQRVVRNPIRLITDFIPVAAEELARG